MTEEILYINAENQILGRLASKVAKLLLNGYRIIIYNAEKSVISGSKERIIEKFKERYRKRTLKNPMKLGHRHPRTPEGILRRAIRGMLPYKKPRGKVAFKRLRVYSGIIDLPKNAKIIRFEDADLSRLGNGYVYLYEICKLFGWKG